MARRDDQQRGAHTLTTLPAWPYPPLGRLAVGILVVLCGASLPAVLLVALLANDPPLTPGDLFRLIRDFTLIPGGIAWLVRRAWRGSVTVGPDTIVVTRPGLRVEVPAAAIARVRPWLFPVPGPGCTLALRSGRPLRDGAIESRDIAALLSALADTSAVDAARAATRHPTITWARARATVPRRRWYHRLGKFPGFALLPTALFFNVHQHITYGGLLGEYYLRGPASWLTTFGLYWATVTIYLVLYAAVWRGAAEAVTLGGAWLAPHAAPLLRRLAEGVCALVFYAGVPALVLIRFLL